MLTVTGCIHFMRERRHMLASDSTPPASAYGSAATPPKNSEDSTTFSSISTHAVGRDSM